MSVRTITANARTRANLNPRLSGSCAIFPLVAMTEIAMPDFRGRNQERSVNHFTLDVRRFIALRTSGEPAYTPACLPSRCRSRACQPAHRVTILHAANAHPLGGAGHAAAAIPGALRCAQRDLARGALVIWYSFFAPRAASFPKDRVFLSNFFLTRGFVACPAKFRHFSAIFKYSKPFRIWPLSGIANPRHRATVAGFWARYA